MKFKRTIVKLFAMLFGIAVVSVFFSGLLFIFETKFQGYPYGLSQLVTIDYKL